VTTPRRPWLFARLAVEGLRRRPARAALLAATTALCVGTLFAALTLGRGVNRSMNLGFSRMGADLMVVPRDTLVNLTPALLTAEPTLHTLPASAADEVAAIAGVERVAPQRFAKVPIAEQGHLRDVDLVIFDPERDFTVLPWLGDKLDRPLRDGDVLVGGRREETPGQELTLGGKTLTVYARLGLTGVGPFDRGYFVTFPTAATLEGAEGEGISAVLVRLSTGARPETVQFALAGRADWKVTNGNSLFTSVRQTLSTVFWGAAVFTLVMLLVSGLMVGSVYSAVVAERRRELGLLLALGMRGRQLVTLLLAEAGLTTALGGIAGVLLGASLLLLTRRSLVYHLEWAEVPFLWPTFGQTAADALMCLALASALGVFGAAVPAWRASCCDPYDLVRAEAG
jgi:putative ABC transport system permease protein